MRLVFNTHITNVFQRTQVVRAFRDSAGNVVFERGPPQWYIQIDDISIEYGEEKPDFSPGQKVTVTIEG